MPSDLRGKLVDQEFMKEPLMLLDSFDKLSPEELNNLHKALIGRDEGMISKILGIPVENLRPLFNVLQSKASEIAKKYPELLDQTKGF